MADAMQVYFKVPVQIRQENGRYFAECFLFDKHYDEPTKFEALASLTGAVQAFMTSCVRERGLDALFHRHDLRLPEINDELTTGSYIDVAIQLKFTPKKSA